MKDINRIYDDLDLNLLRVFLVVFDEGNVTRAADRLHLTQPAVSASLKRLRRWADDPLFQRTAKGVKPTSRAVSMAGVVREALRNLDALAEPRVFDPATSRQEVWLACSDLHAHLLLPKLALALQRQAPGIRLRVRPAVRLEQQISLLESGQVDLVFSVVAPSHSKIREEVLFTDSYCCFVRRDHPVLLRELSVDTYCELRHLAVSLSGDPRAAVDRALEEIGLSRKVTLTINQFGPVPGLIEATDLACTALSRLAELFPETNSYRRLPLPVSLPEVCVRMLWHERQHNHPALQWLKDVVRALEHDLPRAADRS